MKSKKIIFILSILILLIIVGLFLFYFNNKNKNTNIEKIENEKVYYDDKYNFTFNYQSSLNYSEEYNKKITMSDNSIKLLDKIISFKDIYGKGIFSIDINKTEYKNIEDWLNNYAKSKPGEVIVFRENTGINIDNNKTIVTHMAGLDQNKKYIFEDYPYEKTIGFIKDGNLFVINTEGSYTELLNSFKFKK